MKGANTGVLTPVARSLLTLASGAWIARMALGWSVPGVPNRPRDGVGHLANAPDDLRPAKLESQDMRLISIIFAMFFAGSAAPADWKEYENPEYSFAIHFPVDPTLEATTFRTADGRSLEAHTFAVEQEAGVFKVTVVEMPGEETGEEALVIRDAAKNVAEGGVIKFDIPHRVRDIHGRQLGIAGANGGYSYVALFYHKQRLYQIEGKALVAGGQAEVDAMRFHQSLDLT